MKEEIVKKAKMMVNIDKLTNYALDHHISWGLNYSSIKKEYNGFIKFENDHNKKSVGVKSVDLDVLITEMCDYTKDNVGGDENGKSRKTTKN